VTRGEHIREIWEFVEKLKHETVCCPHCRRSNTETLNNRGQQKSGSGTSVKFRDESSWVPTYLYM
jgi:hypothetical protein